MPVILNPRAIGVMIALGALGTVLFMTLSHPTPFVLVIIGALLGAVVGVLHGRSITLASELLRSATSSAEVHRTLGANVPGRRANAVHWISWFVVFGVAIWQGNLLGAFAGYSAFEVAREGLSIRAVIRLNRQFRARGQ